MTEAPSARAIVDRAAAVTFDRPLVTNVHRSVLVEAIVDAALAPTWTWCAADYASWDFEHSDGTRLEVKQSAARQSWATETSATSKASFDVAPRTGFWENQTVWIDLPGRSAHIYVLAHHPVAGVDADHRDPLQWDFYVVPTCKLPPTKRVSLAGLGAYLPNKFDRLFETVEVQRLARRDCVCTAPASA
jgi:hypothetical protein